jgi:hypothetical protein
MASGSPKHHVDRLGHRLGDRFGNPALTPEERIGTRRVRGRNLFQLKP